MYESLKGSNWKLKKKNFSKERDFFLEGTRFFLEQTRIFLEETHCRNTGSALHWPVAYGEGLLGNSAIYFSWRQEMHFLQTWTTNVRSHSNRYFFTVHTFVKTDFKGNCAKKSTLWLLICCKKLILDSQDKQSMKKIRWNRQAYGINGGWGTHVSEQNRILAFTGPDPRGGLWVFSRTSRWV